MFIRLFAFLLLSGTIYTLGVFLAPEFTDTYGNREFNRNIRSIKWTLENFSSWGIEAKSLMQSAQDIAKPYIEETKNTANQIKSTFDTKTIEVKQAAESVQNAVKAVEWAKTDLQKLSNFGTWSK